MKTPRLNLQKTLKNDRVNIPYKIKIEKL